MSITATAAVIATAFGNAQAELAAQSVNALARQDTAATAYINTDTATEQTIYAQHSRLLYLRDVVSGLVRAGAKLGLALTPSVDLASDSKTSPI
jgi:hypothetical protein